MIFITRAQMLITPEANVLISQLRYMVQVFVLVNAFKSEQNMEISKYGTLKKGLKDRFKEKVRKKKALHGFQSFRIRR